MHVKHKNYKYTVTIYIELMKSKSQPGWVIAQAILVHSHRSS